MLLTALLIAAQTQPDLPRGDYVEARTASVFAGACHYGSEYTTQGRAAVLGWSFTGGAHEGVDLAGVDLVAVVDADANLAEPDARRRAVLYLDNRSTPAQRAAARAWVEERHAGVIGEVVRVKVAPVDVAREDDAFRLAAGRDVALAGDALADRACCKMPFDVWYEPLAPVDGRLVGRTEAFRVREPALDRAWSRPGENAAFFGAF